jgi:prophage regulatory protein
MSAEETHFLRIKDVLKRVPVSRPTIYRLIEKDEFPKPVKLGCVSMWPEKEIDDWMKSKVQDRG